MLIIIHYSFKNIIRKLKNNVPSAFDANGTLFLLDQLDFTTSKNSSLIGVKISNNSEFTSSGIHPCRT